MFEIHRDADRGIVLVGRLDAASAPVAREFLSDLGSSERVDLSRLDYIASVGLGILVGVQRRLAEGGFTLVLAGMSPHLREVMSLAGFEAIFDFE